MSLIVAALLGVSTWSFLEYVIHRWAGHDRRVTRSQLNPFGMEHTRHHSEGDYFAPSWKKAGAAVVITGLAIGPAVLVAGTTGGMAYVAGFVSFYLYYEWLHRRLHTHPASNFYGDWARRHHFWHHFHNPTANHGVTSPIWDVVFGTRAVAEQVRVPERLAMQWLVDPSTQDVWAAHQHSWELRKLKKRQAQRQSA